MNPNRLCDVARRKSLGSRQAERRPCSLQPRGTCPCVPGGGAAGWGGGVGMGEPPVGLYHIPVCHPCRTQRHGWRHTATCGQRCSAAGRCGGGSPACEGRKQPQSREHPPQPSQRGRERGRGRRSPPPPHLPLHPQSTPAPHRRPAVGTTAISCGCMSNPRADASGWALRSASLRVRSSRPPGASLGVLHPSVRPSVPSLQSGNGHAGMTWFGAAG